MKKHIFKHLVPFALACLVTVGLFTGCEKKPEKETQQTTVSTQEETTTSEEVVTTTTAPTTEAENPAELSVDMLTSHWLMQSIQSNYVFRFYADGTFESFFDCSSFDRSDKRLTYDSCGTYTLNGNELAIHVNATNYFSAFDYTVTYLRKDQHPEIKNWDIATGFPDDEWFFYETNFHGDPNYDNAKYFAWVDDDAFYDSCKITGRPSDKTNAADAKENFNEFFTRNKLENIHELCDYESIGYAILQSSSSFQINWNTCIQAFCNKDFIDLSKLKFQPQYYYETVLLQSIAKTKLNDDYLEALASEAKNLLIDAADVFLTLDSDFNSYDDLYETKLNEATDLFGGTSPEVHKLYKAYGKYTSAENFYDDVKFVYDSYKEINGTCGDFLTALNNYEISQSVSAELILALEYVRDSIQTEASKENQYLVKAIDEVLKQTRQSRDASMKDFIGKTAKEQVLGFVISVAKDIVSPIATGFDLESIGADTVITISDTLFPTSMSSDSCCKIYADYAFEYVYQEALNRALSSNDESKAAIVVGLYDLLSNTYMHEIEVAKILASQIYKDGLINCLRNLFSYKSDYEYVTECIQAYKADLYAITKERTAALTAYGFAVGLQQPITIVCYQNGKVIYYHETSVPTGTCYKPEVDTERFAQMLGMNIDINAFYTDSALTIMYDSTQSVNAPLTLFCNVSLSARNSSEKQMVDYSTGIMVANHSEADSTMLRTQQMLSGSTYDRISSNLGTENFSLYDITMTRQNSPIQPSTQVQVKIPLLINDAQKVGKVYRVENGQFSDMKSYIEDDYYCFNTTHFSEYVVSLIPITSKEESCENDPNRCPSIIFTDAPSYGNWAHAGIDYCVSHGLMNGVGKGQFDPNGTLTRAMLVTVLYRVQGEPDVSGLENPFEDVPDGMWYTEPIIWAASKQVVNGTSAATFEPDAPITREQIAAILYRYAKEVEGADVSASAALDGFSDAASVSAYARTPLGWASALGYIKGSNENGTLLLNPQGNATRAEVATILMRYLER